jgi:3-oxoacid CoA-transferase subunit B
VIVVMTHCARDGAAKLVPACTLPLTGLRPADWVVTELATFRVDDAGLWLVERAPGVGLEEIRARTLARFRLAEVGTASEELRHA